MDFQISSVGMHASPALQDKKVLVASVSGDESLVRTLSRDPQQLDAYFSKLLVNKGSLTNQQLFDAIELASKIFSETADGGIQNHCRFFTSQLVGVCMTRHVSAIPPSTLKAIQDIGVYKDVSLVSNLSKLFQSMQTKNYRHIADGAVNELGLASSFPDSSIPPPETEEQSLSGQWRETKYVFKVGSERVVAISVRGKGSVVYDNGPHHSGRLTDDPQMVAFTSAAYVEQGENEGIKGKASGLSVVRGKIFNHYCAPNMDGFLMIRGSRLEIVSLQANGVSRPEGYTRFVGQLKQPGVSGFQSHLIFLDGKSMVTAGATEEISPRRFFVTFYDGSYGLIHFQESITLRDAASLLGKISGVRSAINLDTGGWDWAATKRYPPNAQEPFIENLGNSYPGTFFSVLIFKDK